LLPGFFALANNPNYLKMNGQASLKSADLPSKLMLAGAS
jgi:hypothetical protein